MQYQTGFAENPGSAHKCPWPSRPAPGHRHRGIWRLPGQTPAAPQTGPACAGQKSRPAKRWRAARWRSWRWTWQKGRRRQQIWTQATAASGGYSQTVEEAPIVRYLASSRLMKHLFPIGLLLACTAAASTTLCETGLRQSPIDIVTAARQTLPPLEFNYRPVALKLANDGHTLRVRFDKGSTLRIGKERFALQQFHFHTPGGDKLGGEEFPMAAHLLHKSPSGQLLAVVVLFRSGAENPLLNTLLPLIPPRADGNHMHPDISVDASSLLPTARGYFRYSGSLTAAPCTEGVDWIVMKQPLTLSPAQLARWRQRYADNMRAAQPLHQRAVLESR